MPRHIVIAKIDQGKLIVTQANKLAEASYSMTLEEKRVVLLIVSLVRKEDGEFKTYRIPITDIRDYLALRSNKLYDDIKRLAALPEHELKALRTAFVKEITGCRYGRIFAASFQTKGWNAPWVEVLFRGWAGKRGSASLNASRI
jgi:hypothetical protein